LRSADPSRDSAPCAALYAPYVEGSAVSFEDRPPSPEEIAGRMRAHAGTHPWLVADEGGKVVGYAYATPHRERAAYRWSVEVSVYVAEASQRRGHARALYEALLDDLRRRGFHLACAGITLPNAASVALHEGFGFEPVGVYREVGWKQDAWQDVGWWQLRLGPPVPPSTIEGHD
jgi:L-amino acid N-acyltransferase YncA